ncbi:MAG: hypothetical protein AAB944_02500, partial [Patescibacteria group bacterium]
MFLQTLPQATPILEIRVPVVLRPPSAATEQLASPTTPSEKTTTIVERPVVVRTITEVDRTAAELSQKVREVSLTLDAVSRRQDAVNIASFEANRALALTNRITNLSNTIINNSTITGVLTGLADDSVPDDLTITSTKQIATTESVRIGTNSLTISSTTIAGSSAGDLTISTVAPAADIVLAPAAGSNVGIGTTSPFQALSVNGGILASSTITSTAVNATSTFFGNILVHNNVQVGGICLGCGGGIVGVDLLVVNATSTFLGITNTASTSQLVVSNLATLGNLLVTGSTTLRDFTALNATTTNATSTTLGVLTFFNAGSSTLTNLLVTNQATSTFIGGIQAAGLGTSNGLTITGGSLNALGITANLGFLTSANLLVTGSTTLRDFTALNATT